MDEREEVRPHPLGICNRMYNFIVRTLTSHALKTMGLRGASLATPSDVTKLGACSRRVQAVHPMAREICVEDMVGPEQAVSKLCYPDVDRNRDAENCCISSDPFVEEEATRKPEAEVASGKGGPRKMVSINDRVEEIKTSRNRNRNRWNKSFEKLPSLDGDIDEVKPLKSILKVGSNLNARV